MHKDKEFAMSFLDKLFGRDKNPESYAYRLKRARSLHGQAIKYVTERREDNDDVVGRSGSLAIHGDTFIVSCTNVDRLFSCYIKDLEASDLMSGDGVIIRGPNLYDGGKMRTITVHFVYYRK